MKYLLLGNRGATTNCGFGGTLGAEEECAVLTTGGWVDRECEIEATFICNCSC
jgi:hypothetical protein